MALDPSAIQGFCVNPLYLFRERVKKIRLFSPRAKHFSENLAKTPRWDCSMGRGGNPGVRTGGKKAASNAKRYPLCENKRIPFTRNPPVSCLLGRCPNPRRTQVLCSGTMDKSIGCAILQIACERTAQRCSASFSRRSFASSCSLSNSRIRSILALAVSSSFISSRAFR